MTNFSRIVTTGLIWLLVPIFVSIVADRPASSEEIVVLVWMAMGAAVLSARALWWPERRPLDGPVKAKRSGSKRVQRLVETVEDLSDEELDELRARLMAADGEIAPLESLLVSGERGSRR